MMSTLIATMQKEIPDIATRQVGLRNPIIPVTSPISIVGIAANGKTKTNVRLSVPNTNEATDMSLFAMVTILPLKMGPKYNKMAPTDKEIFIRRSH